MITNIDLQQLAKDIKAGKLFLDDLNILTPEQNNALILIKKSIELSDLLQLTKKIQLNSSYGALLSAFFRFGRKEMGASVTASGRQITTFMIEQIGKLVSKKDVKVIKRTHVEKDGSVKNIYTTDSDVILLSDTDSCYFLTGADNKDEAVRIADEIGEAINAMFPAFMRSAFLCNSGFDGLIKASREIVGSAGLFLPVKKKYTIKVVNLDGFNLEIPKLKTMGSEMKKSDTPKVIQEFLKDLMHIILDGGDYLQVEKFVNSNRGKLIRGIKNPVSLGVAKQINNLDALYAEWQRTEKVGKGRARLPGHVRAAVVYNELAQEFAPGRSQLLHAGDKGLVFYLAPNDRGYTSIAFPADITEFPEWFLENFEIDKKMTETKMIDSKIQRIFDVLNWDIPTPQKTAVKKLLKF